MLAAGDLAPAFRLGSFELTKRDTPVLLAFFKITCPTCQLTFPYLQRLFERAGLPIVGISQDGPEGTQEFVETFGVRFETVEDPASAGYAVSNAYGIEYVPSLFLVEPDGRIGWASEGFRRQDLETLGARWGVTLFGPADRVPVFKPG